MSWTIGLQRLLLVVALCGAPGTRHLRAAPAAGEDPVVRIGRARQLLVDDQVIATRDGVVRRLGPVRKLNEGKPIFIMGRFYGTVVHDEGRFKMWYRRHDNSGYGYAESADGLRFEHKGDVTGINFAGDYTLSVTIDAHEKDRDHRYKAAYDGPGMAAAIAHSADGLRWTPYHDGKAVTHRAADTYNQILWDELASTYRLFTRTDFGTPGGTGELRGTRGMINPDVKADPSGWRTVRSWKFDREGPDEAKRRQMYALTDWIHEGIHFALMTVYEWPGDLGEGPQDFHRRHERDVLNFYIAVSRDADRWDLSWVYAGQPMIPRGPDGAFDKDILFPASSIVTHDDKHWLYYCGANERHGDEQQSFDRAMLIGVAVLPRDRFIGLAAGERPGTVLTRPFVLEGPQLEVNIDAGQGEARVEVLDAQGHVIPGYGAAEATKTQGVDTLCWRPAWKNQGDLKTLQGRTVQLRFHLREATIYAFRVGN